MNIKVSKIFLEDFNKINDATFRAAFQEILEVLMEVTDLQHPQIKKVTGHETAFRIGMGFYQIGFYQTIAEEIVLIRLVHREQISAIFG